MTRLKILYCDAHARIQDFGRPGYLAQGLSKSGAADCLALEEDAVLLGQVSGDGTLEMAGFGGVFQAQRDMKFTLNGASMKAELDGTPLAWIAAHHLPDGAILRLGGMQADTYAYLSVGGGFDTEVFRRPAPSIMRLASARCWSQAARCRSARAKNFYQPKTKCGRSLPRRLHSYRRLGSNRSFQLG